MARLALLMVMLGCGAACSAMVGSDTLRLGDGGTRDGISDDRPTPDSEPSASSDGNGPSDAPGDVPGDGVSDDAVDAPFDGGNDAAGDDTGVDAPVADTGVDTAPTCTDLDSDGYGVGPACLGLDCDDADSGVNPAATEVCNDKDDDCNELIDEGLTCSCVDGETRACYTGPGDTLGVGVCAAGLETCASGAFGGACVGEIGPAAEACDGRDDNCNGAVDEGLGEITCGVGACERTVEACVAGELQTCTAGPSSLEVCDGIDNDCNGTTDEAGSCACMHVRKVLPCCTLAQGCSGNESNPFCTISEAILRAMAPGGTMRVCVAADYTGFCRTEDYDEAITMVEGLKLHGNFHPVTWTRGNAECVTRIRATNTLGVYFPPGTTRATEIDGFRIEALTSGSGQRAAVTFAGSSGVLASSFVQAGSLPECYGVLARDGDSPLITGDTNIFAGTGSATTAAVRCIGTALEVRGTATEAPALYGGSTVSGVAHGLWATDCAGLYVDGIQILGGSNSSGRSAGIFLEGDNSNVTITSSTVRGAWTTGGGDAHGIWLSSCTGTEPWIVANERIQSGATPNNPASRGYGVYAQAGCDVAIERNILITGGGESRNVRGITCVGGAQCTIQRNDLITGGRAVTQVVGIYCGPDSCRDISNNLRIVGGSQGSESIGVELDRSGPTVQGNLIEGGCLSSVSVGVELNDSYARLVNNVITPCAAPTGGMPPPEQSGIRQINGLMNEPDVHSNTIDGGRVSGACNGRAVSIMAGAAAVASGVYRNNILHAGRCSKRYGFQELALLNADPRIVENNDFWNATDGAYLNEATIPLNTEVAINGLIDCTSSGNLVRDPRFVDTFDDVHLDDGSACIDRGTSVGMPAIDFEGDSRPLDDGPDIGADEHD